MTPPKEYAVSRSTPSMTKFFPARAALLTTLAAAFAILAGGARRAACGDGAPPADRPAPTPLVQAGWRVMSCGDGFFLDGALVRDIVQRANARQPGLNLAVNTVSHVDRNNALAVGRALAEGPQLVFIHLGSAELEAEGAQATARYGDKLAELIRPFKALGVRVALLTPLPRPDDFGRDAAAEFINSRILPFWAAETYRVAEAEQLPVFDLFMAAPALAAAAREKNPGAPFLAPRGQPAPEARERLADAIASFLLAGPGPREEEFADLHAARARAQGYGAEDVLIAGPPPRTPEGGQVWGWDERATPAVVNNARQLRWPVRWNGPADCSGLAYAGWNSERLCLGFRVFDQSVAADGDRAGDGVRVFLDLRPLDERSVAAGPGFVHFFLAPGRGEGGPASLWAEAPASLHEGSGARWAKRPDGYVVEISLPWKTLVATLPAAEGGESGEAPFKPVHGADIGFGWTIQDRDAAVGAGAGSGAEGGVNHANWSGEGDPWMDASLLGRLILADPDQPQAALMRTLMAPRALRAADAGASDDELGELLGEPVVELRVTAADWRVDGRAAATPEALAALLREATKEGGALTPIRLMADDGVVFQRTLDAMKVLTELKLNRVDVVR